MSKYAIITWTLSMTTLAVVGAGYLYSNSNQSSADTLIGDVQTTITLDGPTTLAPPDPSDTSTNGTTTTAPTTPTTTDPTTTNPAPTTPTTTDPTPADTTTTDPAPTTPAPTDTTPADPGSTTADSPANQTPDSTTSTPATSANPGTTTKPSTTKPTTNSPATSGSADVAIINGTSIIKTATEIKQIITNSLVMHRTVSADKSRDAVKIQFTIPEANAPVTIAIQSDPIVVRTTSDKNGNVVYEVTDPLQPGNHTLTISITDPKDPAKIISVIKPFTLPAISTASDLNTSANLITKEQIVIPIQYLFALVLSVLVTSAVSYAIYRHHSSRDTDLSLEG